MNRLGTHRSAILAVTFLLAGGGAFAQECTTPGPNDLYTDKDDPTASDSNDGRYRKDGGTGPFKTIQRLVDALQPGQCGFVRASLTPYFEKSFKGGDYSGIVFTRGGTSERARIVLSGYPGERPVIDQQRASANANSGYGVAGFFVKSGSYITIRNFEVRNTAVSAMTTNPSGSTSHIVFENNHVHSVAGNGNANNTGGIRIDYCDYCIVRGNVIHDIGDDDRSDGVNGFQPGGGIIENNLIYNVALAIQLKQADADHLDAHIVRGNIFVNINDAVFKMQVQGAANLAAPRNAQFYDNVVYNAKKGVWADLAEAGEQATSLKIFNNTFYGSGPIATLSNFTGVEVFNNIYVAGTSSLIFNTVKPDPWKNSISYFDNNLYFNTATRWEINTYGNPSVFTSLEAWRTASRDVQSPDLRSKVANPGFAISVPGVLKLLAGDVSDFALSANSPAIGMGRYGDAIGAVRPGVMIGPQNVAIRKVPMSPASLTVE